MQIHKILIILSLGNTLPITPFNADDDNNFRTTLDNSCQITNLYTSGMDKSIALTEFHGVPVENPDSLLNGSLNLTATVADQKTEVPNPVINSGNVFPGATWQTKTPAEAGLDDSYLNQLVNNLGSGSGQAGVIIKDGYLVKQWGNQTNKIHWVSSRKAVNNMILLFALHEGKISSLDDLVRPYVQAVFGQDLIPADQQMTFRHLANMTSNYGLINADPGESFAYSDLAVNMYCKLLFRNNGVFNNTDNDANTVFNARLGTLQFQDGDIFNTSSPYRIYTTPRDFARIGWFWVNKGFWNGSQLLPQEYFDNYVKPDVPNTLPSTTTTSVNDYLNVNDGGANITSWNLGQGIFGLNWWFNDIYAQTNNVTWPDVPHNVYLVFGQDGSNYTAVVVFPDVNIVVAAKGNWGMIDPGNSNSSLNLNLKLIFDSIIDPPTPSDSSIKIMPLGDSITRGVLGASDNSGYRKPLVDLLENFGYKISVGSGRDFDFVGSQFDGFGNFDKHHEGYNGWHVSNPSNTSISILHNIIIYLIDNSPDVILLHVGTNDITHNDSPENIVNDVEDLLDSIYTFNSDITVILAKIINRIDDNDLINNTNSYNNALEKMAQQRINNGDNLYLVDAGEDFIYQWDDSPPFEDGDIYDDVHPNDSGYVKIARVWFDKLKEILTPGLVSPADESTDQPENVTFSWNVSLGAGTYHLQVATASDFNSGSLIYNDSTLTSTSQEVALTGNAQYYWRVRAKINTGSSPFSEIRTLTTALPVELSAFTIKLKNKTAELFWRTETEVNNFGFEIERASFRQLGTAPLQWKKIGFVEGHGNSNSPKEYLYIDKNLFGSSKFIYRLKQIDTDGAFAYSGEVEITLLPEKFELFQNYPNPFNPVTNIEFSVPYNSFVSIKVYNILGQHIKTLLSNELEAGNHRVLLDSSDLSSGTYIYRLTAEDFVQTRKMVLLK